MNPTQRLARTAGLYYLVVAVLGAFAHIVRGIVYVPGDATTTAARVVENVALVRYSVAADLVQATFLVFVVLALHRLLHHVDARVARTMPSDARGLAPYWQTLPDFLSDVKRR